MPTITYNQTSLRSHHKQYLNRHPSAIAAPSFESLSDFHSAVAEINRSSHTLILQLGQEYLTLFLDFGSEEPPAVSALANPSVEMSGSLKAWGEIVQSPLIRFKWQQSRAIFESSSIGVQILEKGVVTDTKE